MSLSCICESKSLCDITDCLHEKFSAIVQVPTALHRSFCSAQNKCDFSPTLVELTLLHTPHHCQCSERAGSEVHVSCREAMDHGSACNQVSDRR